MSRILVVDDEEVYRRYLALRLRRDGHRVETAGTVEQALARFGRLDPDILIVDWMLDSGTSGIHLFEMLREEWTDLRVVLITGYPGGAADAEIERVGIERVLHKPFALEELSQLVFAMEEPVLER